MVNNWLIKKQAAYLSFDKKVAHKNVDEINHRCVNYHSRGAIYDPNIFICL
jgi:hypothetical protein